MDDLSTTQAIPQADYPIDTGRTLDDALAAQAQAERKKSQLVGIEFQGVMCSATGDDQTGLSAIFLKHSLAKMAGKTFPDVHFRFENGSRLTLNAGNIDDLDAVWTPFRMSFFPHENAA